MPGLDDPLGCERERREDGPEVLLLPGVDRLGLGEQERVLLARRHGAAQPLEPAGLRAGGVVDMDGFHHRRHYHRVRSRAPNGFGRAIRGKRSGPKETPTWRGGTAQLASVNRG